ncbi:hypothetical protein P3H15_47985 [Rhodococcus sp. T2V]|uniref:hypothetical protein n=1 Tax=Rhodococcus sp. T2V TaxID=3034164 RepID=UPI0023E342CA|nr:hypothetical protein [Rhodococcus sp. T2V]MDF3312689.1 hypothetical protein [Rhodococcus sp. T2V]
MDTLAACLGRQDLAIPPGGGAVPRGGKSGTAQEAEGGFAFVPALASHAGGSVGEDHAPQSDLFDRPGGPEVATGQQPDLLVEIEARDEFVDAL